MAKAALWYCGLQNNPRSNSNTVVSLFRIPTIVPMALYTIFLTLDKRTVFTVGPLPWSYQLQVRQHV